MSLGNNKELAESKLILLYIIDKIGMSVSNLQIAKLILDYKLMNYFFSQQFLNELCEGNLLECTDIEGNSFYNITQNGKQTLNYFQNLIPYGIKARIDNTMADVRKNIKNATHITADFITESENEFVVNCGVQEDRFSLIDLKITVGTRSDARQVCDNWKKHSQEIYTEIIDILIKKRE